MISKKKDDSKQFRLRNKKLFITYSDIDWKGCHKSLREHVLLNFERIFELKRDNFLYIIVVEEHQDSDKVHVHSFLEFKTTQCIYSVNKLDIDFLDKKNDGKTKKEKHPNILPGKNKQNRVQYMLKDIKSKDEILTNENLQIVGNNYYKCEKEYLANMLTEIGLEKTLDLLHTHYKKLCITNGIQIELQLRNMWERIERKKNLTKVPEFLLKDFENTLEVKTIIEWFKEAVNNEHKTTLIVSGTPGTGKTKVIFAIAYEFHQSVILVNHTEGLKSYDPMLHRVILIDDMNPEILENREQMIAMLDVENDRSIRALYRNIIIPAGAIKIITTNKLQDWIQWQNKEDIALSRRVKSVIIEKPLFKNSLKFDEKLAIEVGQTTKND